MKRILAVTAVVALLAGCGDKMNGPLGFEWEMTVAEIKSLGYPNTKCDVEGEYCTLKASPDKKSPFSSYLLSFDERGKLKGIVASSDGTDKDSWDFIDGEKKYKQVSDYLSQSYGEPTKIDEHINNKEEKFYRCLEIKGCGKWERRYEDKNTIINQDIRINDQWNFSNPEKGYVTAVFLKK
ncbi:TPA: hypothetical protein RG501_RS15035 [Providencia rettgeri]|nr:hypothetical protein [Providencia rettgeri]